MTGPIASTPPPLFDQEAPVFEPRPRVGLFARVWARVLSVFGRRVGDARA